MGSETVVLAWNPNSPQPKFVKIGELTVKCMMVSSKHQGIGKQWVLDFSTETERKVEKGNGVSEVWRKTLGLEWRVTDSDGQSTVTFEYKK